jgi:predicted PurR-regulated permease PerM
VAGSDDDGLGRRKDLAWAISAGGIATVAFAALLALAWYFAATLFLIFAGMLLGVVLNALTHLLGRIRCGLPPSAWCWPYLCPA